MRLSMIFAAAFLVLGVVIVLLPWYILPVCEVYDMYMVTAMGTEIPMKCGWTARAVMATGTGIAVIGALLFVFGKRKETVRALGLAAIPLGLFTSLFPQSFLIGVCASVEHPCVLGTAPALLLLGALTVVLSLALVFTAKEGP